MQPQQHACTNVTFMGWKKFHKAPVLDEEMQQSMAAEGIFLQELPDIYPFHMVTNTKWTQQRESVWVCLCVCKREREKERGGQFIGFTLHKRIEAVDDY